MKPEIKEKWIAALRSGQYTQVKGALRRDTGYCCLGVLCDLFVNETGRGQWSPPRVIEGYPNPAYDFCTGNFGGTGRPTSEVAKWAGISTENLPDTWAEFVNLNDNEKQSFDFIADFIEKEFES